MGVPADVIESTARKAVILSALGWLTAIAVAIGGAMLFGRRLVSAIDQAARAAASLGRGELAAAPSTHVDEVDNVHVALRDAGLALQRTEQERYVLLQAAREAQALAEQQNQAKDSFLAMLGHELRNPLSAIIAGVSLIDRADIGPEAARRARDVIKRQSRLLTHIVDELLDASRVMTGKVALSKQRLDLGETAYACLSALHARGLSARYQVDTSIVPVEVHADPTRLAQIINNLLENAFKYTPEGGRIALQVDAQDGHARVRVSDTGIGIGADLLPHIFDVFVQAPASLDRARAAWALAWPWCAPWCISTAAASASIARAPARVVVLKCCCHLPPVLTPARGPTLAPTSAPARTPSTPRRTRRSIVMRQPSSLSTTTRMRATC